MYSHNSTVDLEKGIPVVEHDGPLQLSDASGEPDPPAETTASTKPANLQLQNINYSHTILASAQHSEDAWPIPVKTGARWYRNLRWTFFSVYRRLFAFVLTVNLAVLVGLSASRRITSSNSATAASINLVVAILMRQEHVINLLFLAASSLPTWVPLAIRSRVAKIYCYGGWHSGCGVAASCWYIAFTALLTKDAKTSSELWPAVALGYVNLVLILIILTLAYPALRVKIHNSFEMSHRFAGWALVAIYWVQIVLVQVSTQRSEKTSNVGILLVNSPAFWCLVIITACIAYPWIRLRHRQVVVEKLSDHAARLHFDYTELDRCMGVRLSTRPLFEAHSFATIPVPGKGFYCLVSNAGDWTKDMIRGSEKRSQIWVKGAPVYGVLRVAMAFKRTVVVSTGSGIGPALSLLNANPELDCRVLWSTRAPLKTYGKDVVDAVRETDPNAVIHDTDQLGRPDMLALTWRLYKESGAEAIVVISNPKVTRKLIYALETRGVPAFAPIFDS